VLATVIIVLRIFFALFGTAVWFRDEYKSCTCNTVSIDCYKSVGGS